VIRSCNPWKITKQELQIPQNGTQHSAYSSHPDGTVTTAPTPEARANGNKPNMKANEVIKIDVNELVLLCRFVKSIPFRRLCMANSTIKMAFFGEQPDKHDQSDLEVDIVFQS
jgi:hypothetical protein